MKTKEIISSLKILGATPSGGDNLWLVKAEVNDTELEIRIDISVIESEILTFYFFLWQTASNSNENELFMLLNEANRKMKIGSFECNEQGKILFRVSTSMELSSNRQALLKSLLYPCISAQKTWVPKIEGFLSGEKSLKELVPEWED